VWNYRRSSFFSAHLTSALAMKVYWCIRIKLFNHVCVRVCVGGTTAAAPPPFRPGNPALCGSCPDLLVTPYYCRLGDLLCYTCMLYLSTILGVYAYVYFVFSLFSGLFSFVDFPSVLWYCWLGLLTCKNLLPYNLYCVGGDVKHCSISIHVCYILCHNSSAEDYCHT